MLLAAAFLSPRIACAQVPPGSYQQSCRSISVLNVNLSAECATRAGSWNRTLLRGFGACLGDIANFDGLLACNFATPPPGNYLQTCRDIWTEPQVLHASCPDSRGNYHLTSLVQFRSCVGDVWSDDGQLRCTRATPPAGSYSQTCSGAWVEGTTLFAHCRRFDGGTLLSGLEGFPGCTRDIANSDGRLVCAVSGRLEYAQACAAQMGTIPDFDCTTGDVLPITVGGVAQNARVNGCDKPVVLGLSSDGQCIPFARLLRLNTGHPNVQTVAICRKYHDRGPADTVFDDIAMIQHDNDTGMTCFYQSPIEANLDGRMVPSPMSTSAAASSFWLSTATAFTPHQNQERYAAGPGGIPCINCHDADAFIWSPYVSQVVGSGGWQPLGKYGPDPFGIFLGPGAMNVSPAKATACTACHRIGINSWNGIAKQIIDWMPLTNGNAPTIKSNQWTNDEKNAVNEINGCVGQPAQATCNVN